MSRRFALIAALAFATAHPAAAASQDPGVPPGAPYGTRGSAPLRDSGGSPEASYAALGAHDQRDFMLALTASGYWSAVLPQGYDPRISEAVRKFQATHSLPIDGVITQHVVDAVMHASARPLLHWGFHRLNLTDALNIWIPSGAQDVSLRVTNQGMLKLENGNFTVIVARINTSLPQLYATQRSVAEHNHRDVLYTIFRPQFWVLNTRFYDADGSEHLAYTRCQSGIDLPQGQLACVSLIWNNSDDAYDGRAMATLMTDGMDSAMRGIPWLDPVTPEVLDELAR